MKSTKAGPHHSQDEELSILRSAVDNTNEAFVTIDENHEVVLFNRAAEKTFGYSREEVIGKDLSLIMTPGCSQDHRSAVQNYIRTRRPKRIGHDTELSAPKRGGGTFPANISFSVAEVGGRLYFTAIISDLTEKKILQKQVEKSERLAALGQFVAEITHEIKNPLMIIGGFANQLLRNSSDDNAASKLKVICGEVLRLERLLNDLKEFYQPVKLVLEKFEIGSFLSDIKSLVDEECRTKGINIELNIDKIPFFIEADRDKLKQVILNLLKNAIEAMQNGGKLQIHSTKDNGLIEISIADEGCGIEECDRERIFSPFFTTKKNGTGLGLSISKGIIDSHAGSAFSVTSEVGKGSIFKITMPAVKPPDEDKVKSNETD